MIVEFLVLLLYIFFFYWYGISYARGSAIYARMNNNGSLDSEKCWDSVCDEYFELLKAIKIINIREIFLEFFDVCHALTKFLVIKYLPFNIYTKPICWLVIFPFILPATIKLGDRYNKYGCIRNHSRLNPNHKCQVNQYVKFLNKN